MNMNIPDKVQEAFAIIATWSIKRLASQARRESLLQQAEAARCIWENALVSRLPADCQCQPDERDVEKAAEFADWVTAEWRKRWGGPQLKLDPTEPSAGQPIN